LVIERRTNRKGCPPHIPNGFLYRRVLLRETLHTTLTKQLYPSRSISLGKNEVATWAVREHTEVSLWRLRETRHWNTQSYHHVRRRAHRVQDTAFWSWRWWGRRTRWERETERIHESR